MILSNLVQQNGFSQIDRAVKVKKSPHPTTYGLAIKLGEEWGSVKSRNKWSSSSIAKGMSLEQPDDTKLNGFHHKCSAISDA